MRLDLDEMLTKTEHIYVKNSSKPKGKIIINFTDGSTGVTRPFNVPRSWVPICVSEAIPREVIRTSTDFRRYLANGILTLIPASEAKKMLETTDAQEELLRLNQSEFASNSKFASQAAKDLLSAVEAKNEVTKLQAEQMKIDNDQAEVVQVNPAVLDVCNRFNNNDLEARLAVNELRIIEEELTSEDCSYVIANTDGQVRTYAKNILDQLENKKAN